MFSTALPAPPAPDALAAASPLAGLACACYSSHPTQSARPARFPLGRSLHIVQMSFDRWELHTHSVPDYAGSHHSQESVVQQQALDLQRSFKLPVLQPIRNRRTLQAKSARQKTFLPTQGRQKDAL